MVRIDPINRHPTSKCKHSQEKLELFTPASNFYSRKLPPLGVRACNLNGAEEINFVINEDVLIRKFQEHTSQWTRWIHGTVIDIDIIRGYVGSFAKRYIVRSKCVDTGKLTISEHLPFLLEIWPICYYPLPSPIPARAYFKLRERANYVFALFKRIAPGDTILEHVWFPAVVLKWERSCDMNTEDSNEIEVQCLAGPDLGTHFLVDQVLPYTYETGLACRRQGDFVMKPDGSLDHGSAKPMY